MFEPTLYLGVEILLGEDDDFAAGERARGAGGEARDERREDRACCERHDAERVELYSAVRRGCGVMCVCSCRCRSCLTQNAKWPAGPVATDFFTNELQAGSQGTAAAAGGGGVWRRCPHVSQGGKRRHR